MTGSLVVYGAALVLFVYALGREDGTVQDALQRACTEFVKLTPRLACALLAAGFVVQLLPADAVGQFLGPDAGFGAILVGSVAGLLVPSGPVLAFALAAAFARQGASVPALVSFITGWSVFATHRIAIFEIPMLGPSFVRLRLLCVLPLPVAAGAVATLALQAA